MGNPDERKRPAMILHQPRKTKNNWELLFSLTAISIAFAIFAESYLVLASLGVLSFFLYKESLK